MPMSPRLLRPRATGFTPKSIAGLAAWYDATVASSLYSAVSGGSAVAADGSVMRWEDLSGSGNHLTQPANTTNNAPLRKVADANAAGKDAILFDGSNDSLATTNTINTASGATLFIVHKFNANADRGMHTFTGVSSQNHHPFGGVFYDGFASGTRRQWTQAYSSARRLYSIISGSSWIAHINGTAVNTVTGVSAASQFSNRIQCIGCGDNTSGSPAAHVNIYMCEIIVYTQALTTTQHSAVSNYLIKKWSL